MTPAQQPEQQRNHRTETREQSGWCKTTPCDECPDRGTCPEVLKVLPRPVPDKRLKWEPYWITPPEIYEPLNAEFHFDYDPCPFPKPKDYDGITAEWGQSNYVNPPFHRENGIGPTAFVRKAIEENKKGKTVVLTIPTQSYVNLLLEAGADVRSLGRVKWLHTVTREPMKSPSPITAFILRSRPAPAPELPNPTCPGCNQIDVADRVLWLQEHDAAVARAATLKENKRVLEICDTLEATATELRLQAKEYSDPMRSARAWGIEYAIKSIRQQAGEQR